MTPFTPGSNPDHRPLRTLVIVLGDQLDLDAAAFDGFDPRQDSVWMAEVAEESTHVWSSKQRIALFLTAMRHFAQALHAKGWSLHYTRLDDPPVGCGTLTEALKLALRTLSPSRLVMTAPGDWRVWKALSAVAAEAGLALDVRPDRHFYTTVKEFAAHQRSLQGKALRLETFYRVLRRRHNILMDGDAPEGGQWNYDKANRQTFGRAGPGMVPERSRFEPDETTCQVLQWVQEKFADHPGDLASFAWPVTRQDALQALADFIEHRLPVFGPYQDAMWPGEPWLYHSQLSAALNLKLLNPREVVAAAEAAYRSGKVPLASAEGFIRQILGWREYVRGIYWTQMPSYLERNAMGASVELPAWYWTGDTDFECLRQTIQQTLQHGYAHHIQRLMVTGLFALLLGVKPKAVHEWYLAVYVDAVEWVELPNTLGMSQYADGGLMASKPYIATGKYIERMGGPCASCQYDPAAFEGETACPFTTLYWDFLMRHQAQLAHEPRLEFQLQRLDVLDSAQREGIRRRAAVIRGEGVSAGDSSGDKARH